MNKEEAKVPNSVKFLFGGLSGMGATFFVQPLDLVKNRMQLSSYKKKIASFQVINTIIKNEGFFSLYNGLSAGLARQATYTTTRLGIYTWLFETFSNNDKDLSFLSKAGLGMTAGAVGSFVGNPTEIALIRMTSDGYLPLSERRNYKNVFDAVIRIFREEGVLTLWRGSTTTITRAMIVNATQLATYSQTKEILLNTNFIQDGIFCHFIASMVSGLTTTITSMPVDIIKTRIQNMKKVNGVPEYNGIFDVLRRIISNEGIFAFWKGFTPYYMRIGPHTVLTFIILEKLTEVYYVHALGIKSDHKTL